MEGLRKGYNMSNIFKLPEPEKGSLDRHFWCMEYFYKKRYTTALEMKNCYQLYDKLCERQLPIPPEFETEDYVLEALEKGQELEYIDIPITKEMVYVAWKYNWNYFMYQWSNIKRIIKHLYKEMTVQKNGRERDIHYIELDELDASDFPKRVIIHHTEWRDIKDVEKK